MTYSNIKYGMIAFFMGESLFAQISDRLALRSCLFFSLSLSLPLNQQANKEYAPKLMTHNMIILYSIIEMAFMQIL